MIERLNKLQEQNVFIYMESNHYKNGSNVLFSIDFRNYSTQPGYTEQTGWYNDNHEFGDFGDVLNAALELAEWYLEDDERIKAINSDILNPYHKLRGEKVRTLMKTPNL